MRPGAHPLRFVLIVAVLPAAIVMADRWALRFGAAQRWSVPAIGLLYGLFVTQVALLGALVGRYVEGWFLRWTLLAWGLVLIDLWVFSLVKLGGYHCYLLMAYALVSGQFGLLAVWATLGPTPWPWRLPAVVVGSLMLILLGLGLGRWSDLWVLLLLIQSLAIAFLCVLARLAGLRLARLDRGGTAQRPSTEYRGCQFSIGHMLFWALAAVPVLVLGPQLKVSDLQFVDLRSWCGLLWIGLCLSVVSLVAVRTVLGEKRPLAWLAALAVVPPVVGVLLRVTIPRSAPGTRWQYRILDELAEVEWWWVAWTLLAGWFLAGLLLMFRAGGYRLVRRVGDSAAGGDC